jgi:dihydroorotate dehydrogenase
MSASTLRSRLITSGSGRRAVLPPTSFSPQSIATRRYASSSSSSSSSSSPSNGLRRLKIGFYSTILATSAYLAYLYTTDTRSSVHRWLIPPTLRLLFPDAEDAHHAGTAALKTLYQLNLHPRERDADLKNASELRVSVFGAEISNPIGISAGLDKDADIPDPLLALGAGVVEVGGCTPLPQGGNPKPRVFRVPSLEGMINRYGLNSRGADAMSIRLRDRVRRFARELGVSETEVLNGEAGVQPGSLMQDRLLAVQIAKNKDTDGTDEAAVVDDHVYCAKRLARYADILVVNVSSPNTPGLRDLQATGPLTRLLSAVVDEAAKTDRKNRPKVMVKVSPDEDDETQVSGIVSAVFASGVDGVIVGNTTKRRDGLAPAGLKLSVKEQKALTEEGGYSGPAMFQRTLDLVGKYHKLIHDESLKTGEADKVIFATGGITNGEQALKVLNAGASIAMIYTGMVYGGAGTVTRIKQEMKNQISSAS